MTTVSANGLNRWQAIAGGLPHLPDAGGIMTKEETMTIADLRFLLFWCGHALDNGGFWQRFLAAASVYGGSTQIAMIDLVRLATRRQDE